MLKILSDRNFFWLWFGQAISQIGDGVRDFAMVFWVFNTSGHSPVVQSFSLIAVVLPSLILGPVAGVWVDRWDRRRIMITADIIRGCLSLALIGAAISGQYWYALGITFLASCVAQFFDTARGAMIPRVVGREHLLQANALGQTTYSLLRVAGPALGTAVYIYLGARSSFMLDAASFFLSALCVSLVAVSGAVGAAAAAARSFLAELKYGLNWVFRSQPVRACWFALATMMLGAGAINTIVIFVVRDSLHLPEAIYGIAMTASPLATLAAAVAVGGMASRIRRVALLVPAGLLLGTLGIAGLAAAQSTSWLIVSNILIGLCNAGLNMGLSTIIQTVVPDEVRGRVMGTAYSVPVAGMVLSSALAGYLARTINPRLILGGADVFLFLGAVVAYAGLRSVVLPAAGRPEPTEVA